MALKVLEELIFCRYLMMMFKMIDHLAKVMAEAVKIYLSAARAPTEVKV